MLSLMSLFRVLLQLNLARNQLCGVDSWGSGTYTAEGIKALADAVAVNASLTQLDLSDNQLGAEGAKALGISALTNTRRLHMTI